MKLNWPELLKHHPIFSKLDDSQVQWLLSEQVSTERTYEPGAMILREGEVSDSIFLIGSGSTEALLSAANGQTLALTVMGTGDSFGEMGVFDGTLRSAHVKAREESVVLEVKAREARRLVDEHPDIGVKLLLTVSERLRRKNEHILTLFALERQARAEAEDANRAKDEFLAVLGHELRNPLGAISAAIQVLGTLGDPNDEVARLQGIIARQTRHLSRLVEDLLDVSKIVSGKVLLHKQSEDLRGLVVRVLSSFHEAGRTAQHVISLSGEPVRVTVDATRLEQVVSNLLDNALKYTSPGGRVDVVVRAEEPDAVLRVRDTGVGIPADMLSRIFAMFVQADQTLDRSDGGLGLGLTVVKRLVELHGGAVSASSEGPNRGSEFVIRLPRISDLPATPELDETRCVPMPPRHVVLIEDNRDFRDSLRMLLESWGHRVDEAANGAQGLDIIRASRPDVVIADLGLPGFDGYAVARAVRSVPGNSATLLVAVTGYGRAEDRRRAKEAGFDAHLTKPVDANELARLLSRPVAAEGKE